MLLCRKYIISLLWFLVCPPTCWFFVVFFFTFPASWAWVVGRNFGYIRSGDKVKGLMGDLGFTGVRISYSAGTHISHQPFFLGLICNLSQSGFKVVTANQPIHLVIFELIQ